MSYWNLLKPALTRSVGVIDDVLVRPISRFGQEITRTKPGNWIPNASGSRLVGQPATIKHHAIPYGSAVNPRAGARTNITTSPGGIGYATPYIPYTGRTKAAANELSNLTGNPTAASVRRPISRRGVALTAAGAGLSAATAQPQKNQFESALNLVAPLLPFGIGIGATAAQVLEGVPTGTFTSARGEGYGTPPEVPRLGQRRADGKFWAGNDYGWQSGASAVKAGLLPSEAVGSTATGQAFGGGSTSQRGSQPSGGAPTAPVLPPPSSPGAGSTRPSSVGGSRQTISSVAPAQGDIQSVAPPAPALPAPVQTGPAVPGTQAGNAAAVQQAPSAIESQFQRYYQGGQMNPFFGGAPSAQAPTSAAAMEEAAMLQRAPTTMPLADYYRAQSATGRANMDQIIGLMGYTGDMEKWARANPMLAQRAFAAQFQGGVPTQGAPGAQPVVDEALNPSSPEFRGVGGNGERIYNFAADDVDAAKIEAFQRALLSKQRQ